MDSVVEEERRRRAMILVTRLEVAVEQVRQVRKEMLAVPPVDRLEAWDRAERALAVAHDLLVEARLGLAGAP